MPTFGQWNPPFINAKKSLKRDDAAAGICNRRKYPFINTIKLQLTYYFKKKQKNKWKEVIIEKTAVKTCFADDWTSRKRKVINNRRERFLIGSWE